MYTQIEKLKKTEKRADSRSSVQKKIHVQQGLRYTTDRSDTIVQKKAQLLLNNSNGIIQFGKTQKDKRATTSTHLTQAQHQRLVEIARKFVSQMNEQKRAEFKACPRVADRRAWLVRGDVPFRVGDVVEEVGVDDLTKHATSLGKGMPGKVITSVTLRYANSQGIPILGPLAEIDALILDSKGRVTQIVSAKLSPERVNPARDRVLINYFYAVDPPNSLPEEKPATFYQRVQAAIPFARKEHLKSNHVTGFIVQYTGRQMPLKDFREQHPINFKKLGDEPIPVIGLTPKSDAAGQAQGAEARGDIQLGLNRDALLDALGDEILTLI